jgi:hypothetical protein
VVLGEALNQLIGNLAPIFVVGHPLLTGRAVRHELREDGAGRAWIDLLVLPAIGELVDLLDQVLALLQDLLPFLAGARLREGRSRHENAGDGKRSQKMRTDMRHAQNSLIKRTTSRALAFC